MNRKTQRGVALVITLILLAMVTVMAVLFLGISRRERTSVNLSANLADAKLAAENGQTRALSEIIARIAAQTNLFAYDFLVSTNFISPKGFRSGWISVTNVSYTYPSGLPLTPNDFSLNLRNLYYDPRPPVFVVTNTTTGASEFRYYLDLNRNGRFDTNGVQRVFDSAGRVVSTNSLIGDPEWIGILERPDLPHSSSNRFIGRYAFVVLPAGKTLDINYIHNNATSPDLGAGAVTPSYLRNQGLGSWEINLAAFLRDLNTNIWTALSYTYNPGGSGGVGGFAFRDAFSFLTNRYGIIGGRWTSPKSAAQAFAGSQFLNSFPNNQIDLYSDGPLMTGLKLTNNGDTLSRPWSGADNTNGYSSIQELFDRNKTSPNVIFPLLTASARTSTYDRNTLYRLMAQMGTDSLPANRGKLNLNYDNVNPVTRVIDPALTTNFVPWTTLRFFTNAADLMLRSQSARILSSLGVSNSSFTLSVTNIPVYPVNLYHANVHRLLQLAANIGDASTNRYLLYRGTNMDYYAPSVFRPLFGTDGQNIYVTGYEEVTNNVDNALAQTWLDLNVATNSSGPLINAVRSNPRVNVYGMPWVIGAKKGLPNFNECLMESSVQVTRRMQVFKSFSGATTNFGFQQAYEIGVSNRVALEAWNSYTQACPFPLTMFLTNRTSLVLSNESLPPLNNVSARLAATNVTRSLANGMPIAANSWKGRDFQVPLDRVEIFVPDSEFHFAPTPALVTNSPVVSYDGSTGFPVPNWKLYVTNRVVYALVATDASNTRRIVDFVNLDNLSAGMDITHWLVGETNAFADSATHPSGMFWQTNRIPSSRNKYSEPPNATGGITNQLWVSINDVLSDDEWKSYSKNEIDGQQKQKEIDRFRKFLGLQPLFHPEDTNVSPGRVAQVPFTPSRKLDLQLSWQVNDPLVHYAFEDLYHPFYADTNKVQPLLPRQPAPADNIRQVNDRSQPWGGKPGKDPSANALAYDVGVKDPLIIQSDDWDFPTNKLPNLGWLGRVHRGTPWQTLYLKSPIEPMPTWIKWAGRADTHPTNDWQLLGLFTTALNDNAARGLLSVNQTNIAAWSAVLSGVAVLTNTLANPQLGDVPAYNYQFIQPASPQLAYIVSNINATRLQMPNQVFPDLGTVLASSALTTNSPYLNRSANQAQYAIRDEVYERIPQQILSLLKADEPYVVIYALGQSLRPAENSVVRTLGPTRGLCTNYQVTAEVFTKTAVRIEELPQQPGQRKSYRSVVESYNVLPTD
jgi:hypothetical protein